MSDKSRGKVRVLNRRPDHRYYWDNAETDGLHFLAKAGTTGEKGELYSLFSCPVSQLPKVMETRETWEDILTKAFPEPREDDRAAFAVYNDDSFFCVPSVDPETYPIDPVSVVDALEMGKQEKRALARIQASRDDDTSKLSRWMVITSSIISLVTVAALAAIGIPRLLGWG